MTQTKRRKLSDGIADQLAERIRSGEYDIGSFFPSERELCEEFGVGRPSIREALFVLQRAGLAELCQGQRPRITMPSPKNVLRELSGAAHFILAQPDGVAHFEQVRSFIEVSLIRYAAEHATNAQIARLRHALEHNRDSIENERLFRETDAEFHRVIAEIPGNPIFLAMHDAFVEWLINQRPEKVDAASRNQRSYDDHKKVFEAVVQRDPAAAAEIMQQHMDYAYALYVQDMDTRKTDTESTSS
ncbi:MAG: transcriptional regulator NanR [Rhodospirillales bacterium]|nr:transcriptional regulator NanR [Rhodospirillales bacterium]